MFLVTATVPLVQSQAPDGAAAPRPDPQSSPLRRRSGAPRRTSLPTPPLWPRARPRPLTSRLRAAACCPAWRITTRLLHAAQWIAEPSRARGLGPACAQVHRQQCCARVCQPGLNQRDARLAGWAGVRRADAASAMAGAELEVSRRGLVAAVTGLFYGSLRRIINWLSPNGQTRKQRIYEIDG